jgi:hypothetical protein
MHRPDEMDAIFKQVLEGLEAEAQRMEATGSPLDMEDREEAFEAVEGAEPGIEKEPQVYKEEKENAEELKDAKEEAEVKEVTEVKEEKVKEKEKPKEKERKSKRKKVSQKDLKRLEEELK